MGATDEDPPPGIGAIADTVMSPCSVQMLGGASSDTSKILPRSRRYSRPMRVSSKDTGPM